MAEEVKSQGNKMVWDVVDAWLASRDGMVSPRKANAPKIIGALTDPGYIAPSISRCFIDEPWSNSFAQRKSAR